jgi:hypothetical protein
MFVTIRRPRSASSATRDSSSGSERTSSPVATSSTLVVRVLTAKERPSPLAVAANHPSGSVHSARGSSDPASRTVNVVASGSAAASEQVVSGPNEARTSGCCGSTYAPVTSSRRRTVEVQLADIRIPPGAGVPGVDPLGRSGRRLVPLEVAGGEHVSTVRGEARRTEGQPQVPAGPESAVTIQVPDLEAPRLHASGRAAHRPADGEETSVRAEGGRELQVVGQRDERGVLHGDRGEDAVLSYRLPHRTDRLQGRVGSPRRLEREQQAQLRVVVEDRDRGGGQLP